jgi:hypothetical protein
MAELVGERLPDAVMGEPGPGWDAWAGPDGRDEGHRARPAPGSYMKVLKDDGSGETYGWYLCDPTGAVGQLSDGHAVTEFTDRSITVHPSIDDPPDGWHGWLRRGVWSDA